jgi:hypothetical protein
MAEVTKIHGCIIILYIITLRNIKAKTIIKTLTILFQQVMHALNIKQFKSNAYHHESQGGLEIFHNILEKYENIFIIILYIIKHL